MKLKKGKGIVIEPVYFESCKLCKYWTPPKADYNNPGIFVQQKCNKPMNGRCPTIVRKQKDA